MKTEPVPAPPSRFHVHSFCQTLTASGTSTDGGFSVLRRHANECLPPLASAFTRLEVFYCLLVLSGNWWL